ncbi:hypothetical protein C1H46_032342 [Malus baccata]|uniref:Glucan endo-1,3-beta-D-glucosidase n=1 Tax=Malus baccata TaxID=106549 RepID=A0A540L6L2_MALBA|nr:hypothetical protein C1H46_032342 [Malus baccata]
MMVDAVIRAMVVARYENTLVVVTETGWPSFNTDPSGEQEQEQEREGESGGRGGEQEGERESESGGRQRRYEG